MDEKELKKERQKFQMMEKGFEKIAEAIGKQNPLFDSERIIIRGKQGDPGKDGQTPKKGVDYWTKSDQDTLVSNILKEIKIPDPIPGKDGQDAVVDYDLIKNFVIKEVKNIDIPEPTPGKDAVVDYNKITIDVLKKIPKTEVDYNQINQRIDKKIQELSDKRQYRQLNSGGPTTRLGDVSDVNINNVSSGQVLGFDGNNWVAVDQAGGAVDSVNGQTGVVVLYTDDINEGSTNLYSQWTTAGSDIYYSGGDVGIGTGLPSAKLHAISTTEQLRLGYDDSNYFRVTVASDGGTTFDTVGGGTFTFSDAVSISSSLTVGSFNLPSGDIRVNTGMSNYVSTNNSKIYTLATGGYIGRNVADANNVLTIKQENASGTGDLTQWQDSSGTVVADMDVEGNLNLDGYLELETGDGVASYLGQIPSVPSYAGIWFNKTRSTASASNYSFLGDGTHTFFNAGGGNVYFRSSNATKMSVFSTGHALLSTSATAISTVFGTTFQVNHTSFPALSLKNSSAQYDIAGHGTGMRIYNGSNYVFTLETDKFGFGANTTSPVNKINVEGNASFGSSYYAETAPTNGLLVEGDIIVGATTGTSAAARFMYIYGASAGYTMENDVNKWSFFVQGTTGGYGLFNHDTSKYTYIADTSDRIGIGTDSTTSTEALLHVKGRRDEEQQIIQGYSTQTSNLSEWRNSGGTVLAEVDGLGNATFTSVTSDDDIEITDSSKGVILESPDSTRWRITVDNTGALTTTSL